MDTVQSPHLQIEQLKCSSHPFQQLDFIDLTGNNGRICPICTLESQFPEEQLLSIAEILEKKDRQILGTYPPFKNQNIKKKIQQFFDENISKENIDKFFKQLRIDIESALEKVERRTKQYFIEHENSQQILEEELAKIEEIEKLKHLLFFGGDKLNLFLREKWNNIEKYENRIEKTMSQNQISLNLESKYQEISKIIQSLADFNLVDHIQKSIIKEIDLIKSTYLTSNNLRVSKTTDNYLQLINQSDDVQHGQAYLDFIFDPNKQYSIKLRYIPSNKYSYFVFGLVSDQNKNLNWNFYCDNLSFSNQNRDCGITKSIKGSNRSEDIFKNSVSEFEVRIFLKEKILQVTSLPDYKNTLELSDEKKINLKTPYRFYVYLVLPDDVIEITDIMELNKINESFSFSFDKDQLLSFVYL